MNQRTPHFYLLIWTVLNRDLIGNPKDNLLVKSILQLGHILGLNVVAEGIETEEQLHHLVQLNCLIGQGFLVSKPVKASELEEKFLLKQTHIYSNKE